MTAIPFHLFAPAADIYPEWLREQARRRHSNQAARSGSRRETLRFAKVLLPARQPGEIKASKTVRNIKGAWVKEQQVVVEGNKVTVYRVDLKITFVLE